MRGRRASSSLFPYTTLFRSLAMCPPSSLSPPAAASVFSQLRQSLLDQSSCPSDTPKARLHCYCNLGSATKPWGQLLAWRKRDRKSTRLNSSHQIISYAVFCL